MTVAKRLKAVRRYVALHTYEVRQGWRHFKEEAAELWQYQCFRFEHWFRQFWPFRSLDWLLSLRAPRDKSFGRFDAKTDRPISLPNAKTLAAIMAAKVGQATDTKLEDLGGNEIEPLTPEQHAAIAKHEPTELGNVLDSVLSDDLMDHGHESGMALDEFLSMQGKRALQLTAEKLAVIKASKVERPDETGDEPRTDADKLTHVKEQLVEAAEILKARETQRIERWKTVLVVSAGAAGVIGFLVAMAVLFFAR